MKVEREDLERSFERFEMPEPALERLIERRERRRRRKRIEAGIAAFVIVAATAALLAREYNTTSVPVDVNTTQDRTAPPWTTADLNGVILTNPGGWHLTGYTEGSPGDIVLANFPPDPSSTDPCTGMLSDGAILRIHPGGGSTQQVWPVELTPDPQGSDQGCDGEHLTAVWSVNGRTLAAVATLGADVSERDRTDLLHAFSSLTFATPDRAVIFSSRCYDYATLEGEVLAADTSGPWPWTMLAISCRPADPRGILIATTHGRIFGASVSSIDAGGGLDVHDYKKGLLSAVSGVVSADVTRVGLEFTDGQTRDALLVGTGGYSQTGFQIYLAPLENLATGIVTTYDASGTPLQSARFSPGMDCADNSSECLPQIEAGTTIAASYPGEGVAWRLREQGTAVELVDGNGGVLGSVAVGDRLAATSILLPASKTASKTAVVFGVAPSGTAVVMRQIAHVGWGIVQTAQLQDGTIIFWTESQPGETRGVAAFDASCLPIGGVDPATGAATDAPTVHTCVGSDGGS